MAELLEKEHETFAHYVLPASIQNVDVYSNYIDDNLVWEKTNRPVSLLNYLQTDILLMRNPDEAEKISLDYR